MGLILAIIFGGILFIIPHHFSTNIWISIIIGLVSTFLILYIIHYNKNKKDPNQDARTRINQPYSEKYPVLLTSVLAQMEEDKKKAYTIKNEIERIRLSKSYQLSVDDANIIKNSINYERNLRKILMDSQYGPSPEFGKLFELDIYLRSDNPQWQQELIHASMNNNGTVFEVRWSPKDKNNVILSLEIMRKGLELANKYPESAYVKYIEMINDEGVNIGSADLPKLEEIIGRLKGLP
jgi:hypothetical protein